MDHGLHSPTRLRRINELPYVLRQSVDTCRGVSFGPIFLFTSPKQLLRPFNRELVAVLDHFRIVKDLISGFLIARTQGLKLLLAVCTIKGSVLVLKVENSPKLETGVGDSQVDSICVRHVLRSVESEVIIAVEHRAEGVILGIEITFYHLGFLDSPLNDSFGVATESNDIESHLL